MMRLTRGLTQAELAQRVGLTQPALSRIEAGQTQVRVEQVVALAQALDVPVMALIRPPMPTPQLMPA